MFIVLLALLFTLAFLVLQAVLVALVLALFLVILVLPVRLAQVIWVTQRAQQDATLICLNVQCQIVGGSRPLNSLKSYAK